MGNSVWLFMWLIDKITKIDNEGWGWVLGGKPIKLENIKHLPRRTTQRYFSTLKKEGYISIQYTMRGMIIKVKKAKKKFNNGMPKVAHLDVKSGAPRVKSGAPNKTVSVDSTVDIKVFSQSKKTMKPHNELQHSDQHERQIDLDTGEDTSYKKSNENTNWNKFVSYWKTQCMKTKNIVPEIQPSKDKPTFHRIKRKFTNQQIVEIIDHFLDDKKSNEHLTITACFSADTINGWKLANK